ncbi:MAG TPA: transglycosylase SLT domain-containing protein, partial [Patescibacteria group bacterium]|nr:transglycosylase SLT domain-containing protein [Patescibacteria group bacterium]
LGAPQYVVDIAALASSRTGMPQALILAQLKKESNFNPRAVSQTNDHGIAQIHFPKPGVTLEQAYDPVFAINWQANNMSVKFRTYGNWRDALAAYNAGDAGRAKGYGYTYADTVLRMAGL